MAGIHILATCLLVTCTFGQVTLDYSATQTNNFGPWSTFYAKIQGQTFKAPDAINLYLQSWTFFFSGQHNGPIYFHALIYQWDPVNNDVIGNPASPLWKSAQLMTTNTADPEAFQVSPNVLLTAGNSYAIMYSIMDIPGTTDTEQTGPTAAANWYTGHNGYTGGTLIQNGVPRLSVYTQFDTAGQWYAPGNDFAFIAVFGPTANMLGDPHIAGLNGESYDFHGRAGHVFNLISTSDLQLNSEFMAPTHPWAEAKGNNSFTFLKSFGLRFGPHISVTFSTERDPRCRPFKLDVELRGVEQRFSLGDTGNVATFRFPGRLMLSLQNATLGTRYELVLRRSINGLGEIFMELSHFAMFHRHGPNTISGAVGISHPDSGRLDLIPRINDADVTDSFWVRDNDLLGSHYADNRFSFAVRHK